MHMSFDYDVTLRSLIAITLTVAWYAISKRTPGRWPSMTRLGKRLWLWYYGLLFAVIYGVLDSIHIRAEVSSKNYILGFFSLGLAISAILKLDGDESTEPVYKILKDGPPWKWRILKLR